MEEVETDKKLPRPSNRIAFIGLIIGLSGVAAIGTLLTPGQGGPVVIMMALASLYLLFLSLAAVLITEISYRLGRPYHGAKVLYAAVLIATGAIFLVGLQTLGQLQLIDVVLVLLFEVLLNFYFFRRF